MPNKTIKISNSNGGKITINLEDYECMFCKEIGHEHYDYMFCDEECHDEWHGENDDYVWDEKEECYSIPEENER